MACARALCGTLWLSTGAGAGQHRAEMQPPKRDTPPPPATVKFCTALGLMWGGRFGGFTGIPGLSSSDLNPQVLHWGPPPAPRGGGRTETPDTRDRAGCSGCCPLPGWCVPYSHSCVWAGSSQAFVGSFTDGRICFCRVLLPFSPEHPAEAARARCTSGARVLARQPRVPPRHGLTGATLLPPAQPRSPTIAQVSCSSPTPAPSGGRTAR